MSNTMRTPQHCDNTATSTHTNSQRIHDAIDVEHPGSLPHVPLTILDNNTGCRHHMVTQSQTRNLKPKIPYSFNIATTFIVILLLTLKQQSILIGEK